MKGTQKNLAASLFAALVFGSSAVYLERGNAGLSEQILERESSSFRNSFVATISESGRKKSLGDFLSQYQHPMTARELQRLVVRSYQFHYPDWQLLTEIYAMQLSVEELSQLRIEMYSLNCPNVLRERILDLIARAESRFHDESLESLFDFVIGTSGVNRKFRSDFKDWAKDDPQGAIAWFRSKDAVEDFQIGSVAGGDSRSSLFQALLEGLAEVNLSSAVEVIESEPNVNALRDIPWSVIEGLIGDARESGSNDLVQRLLKAHPMKNIRSNDPFEETHFWTEFTKATGDVERSVLLLDTLDEDRGYGIAMAQIISGMPDLTFGGKADWLAESIPASSRLADGLSELSARGDASPFSDWVPVDPDAIPWLTKYPGGEVKDSVLNSLSQKLANHQNHAKAYQLVTQIENPDLREFSLREVARGWFDDNPAQAGHHLPANLLKSLSE